MDVKPVGPRWRFSDIGTQQRNPLLHYVKFNQNSEAKFYQKRRNKFLIDLFAEKAITELKTIENNWQRKFLF